MAGKLSIGIAPAQGSPEVQVVRVEGFLDAATYRELTQRAGPLVNRDKPLVVVDLTRLEYLGSAGVAALMDMAYTSQDHDGEVALAGPSPKIREVLRTLGLSDLLSVKGSVDEAVESLRGGQPSPVAASRSEAAAATNPFGTRAVEFVGAGAQARVTPPLESQQTPPAAVPPEAPAPSPAAAPSGRDERASVPAPAPPAQPPAIGEDLAGVRGTIADLVRAQRDLAEGISSFVEAQRKGLADLASVAERLKDVAAKIESQS